MSTIKSLIATAVERPLTRAEAEEALAPFREAGWPARLISAHTGEGLQELRFEVWRMLQEGSEDEAND